MVSQAKAAPADGTYRVLVRDLYNRGSPRFVYRLAIRREQPDFRLAALAPFPVNPQQQQVGPWSTLLRKGSSESLQVLAFRRDGFNENIEVTAEGLPPAIVSESVLNVSTSSGTLQARIESNGRRPKLFVI